MRTATVGISTVSGATKPFISCLEFSREEILTLSSKFSVGEVLSDDQVQAGKYNFSVGNMVGVTTDLDLGIKRVGLVTGFSRQRGVHLAMTRQSATVFLYSGHNQQDDTNQQDSKGGEGMDEMHVQDHSQLCRLKLVS